MGKIIRTYGFLHRETTGITSFVIVGDKDIPIQFRSDSNPAALDSLYDLRPEVFLPNANGIQLEVTGILHSTKLYTPRGENLPQSEVYQEFTLQNWYILTPFQEIELWPGEESTSPPKIRSILSPGDFEKIKQTPQELRRFLRPVENKQATNSSWHATW